MYGKIEASKFILHGLDPKEKAISFAAATQILRQAKAVLTASAFDISRLRQRLQYDTHHHAITIRRPCDQGDDHERPEPPPFSFAKANHIRSKILIHPHRHCKDVAK